MKVSGIKKSVEFVWSASVSGRDALKALNEPIAFVAMRLDGTLVDLSSLIPESTRDVQLVPSDSPDGVEVIRHGCAHIMAQAVQELFPGTQVTIGPVIENGFYYDFVREGGFREDELPKIEARMKELIDAKLPVRREDWEVDRAIAHFKKLGEHYKVEIIQDIVKQSGVKTVSVYFQGDAWADLCRGPHVPTTGHIPAFKLMSVAGAYWRGDEKNAMLARIYGTAWASKDALKAYLNQLEEAKKRDHRKIGSELSLFSFHPEAPAAPFFHPSGAFVYVKVQEFLRDLNKVAGFEDVISPLIMSQELWKTSGHYDNYRENMYFTEVDERAFAVKPMNCPGHCLIYRTHKHSYRDLPLRWAEFGRVHRHERSGVTAGLFRVRSFVQDDAHIFCRADQIEAEILNVLKMVKILYGVFGFEYQVELSTRPLKRMGAESVWDQAEGALSKALEAAGQAYKVNPGDGAFYGPKIDFHLKDSIGRTHQCGTVQLDFQMPERFGLEFTGSDNTAHKPVMIHRAIAGSLERFLGIYIEHVAGLFPMWLAPKQAAILTVSDDAKDYGQKLYQQMKSMGFRVLLDDSSDKLAGKIKHLQPLKLPYMIIIGSREAAADQVSLRLRSGEQLQGISRAQVLDQFSTESQTPTYNWA
jgi:threonyl-tRNA synthetase